MRVVYVCQYNLSMLVEYVTTLLSTCCRVFFNGVFVVVDEFFAGTVD